MTMIGSIPRRCVNLPPGSLRTLIRYFLDNKAEKKSAVEKFCLSFAQWIGTSHVFGAFSGRSAFQLALEALELEKGAEIIFPVFTFPVIPMVAKILGYKPVFCEVDPNTYNSGPEQIEPKITDNTGAILATHLFGQPCRIREIAEIARKRKIFLLEDCAHACGVRIDGRQVGTFGDIGVFSFAEGKNMPCFGGGAIATSNDQVAEKARQILYEASVPAKRVMVQKGFSIWLKWLLTQPFIFGITAYPVLRLKLLLQQPLMDAAVGEELLETFIRSNPRVTRMSNLQAAIGLLQLNRIDPFNEGARRNARILTDKLLGIPGIQTPDSAEGDHIYVYYPLRVDPAKRDDLRHYLLKHGFDTKTSDMSDCTKLRFFRNPDESGRRPDTPREASILEICVYPVISEGKIHRLGDTIRNWAGLPKK
jgi:dTDP-4-amino-4,6-dideoxygalactose transaminase